jgi:hydroxymethylpyrimidine pyrophosphatase-like HAD family hydrolase
MSINKVTTPRIRLIATDIDGTLLDSQNTIQPASLRALKQALDLGVKLVLVTARKQSSAFAIADMLGLPCACIAHNGARTWDWQGRELRHLVLDLAWSLEIVRFADQQAIPLVVTVDEVNYYNSIYPVDPTWLSPTEHVVASLETVLSTPPTRLIVAGQPGIEQICALIDCSSDIVALHRYYSRVGSLDSAVLTHPRATKEDALAELALQWGVAPEEILALGDAEADVGMLRWAGVGVAMGNAMPEALAAAHWVAPSHDDAGFAVAVERFVLRSLADQAVGS